MNNMLVLSDRFRNAESLQKYGRMMYDILNVDFYVSIDLLQNALNRITVLVVVEREEEIEIAKKFSQVGGSHVRILMSDLVPVPHDLQAITTPVPMKCRELGAAGQYAFQHGARDDDLCWIVPAGHCTDDDFHNLKQLSSIQSQFRNDPSLSCWSRSRPSAATDPINCFLRFRLLRTVDWNSVPRDDQLDSSFYLSQQQHPDLFEYRNQIVQSGAPYTDDQIAASHYDAAGRHEDRAVNAFDLLVRKNKRANCSCLYLDLVYAIRGVCKYGAYE